MASMPHNRREAFGFCSLLILLALSVNPVTAEVLPPLRIEPSLLGSTPLKPPTATRPTEPTVSPPPTGVATVQKSPAAEPVAAQSRSATGEAPGHFVQVGAFSLRANAEARLQQLASELGPLAAKLLVRQRGELFLVQIGPWADAAAARSVSKQLRERHRIESVYVVVGR